MKKLTSIFLALSMLSSLAPMNIFAAKSEPMGNYNSLKIPVVNEVREENTYGNDDYGIQTMSLSDDD